MRSFTSFLVLLLSLELLLADCASFPKNEVEALTSFKRAIIEDPMLVCQIGIRWTQILVGVFEGFYCTRITPTLNFARTNFTWEFVDWYDTKGNWHAEKPHGVGFGFKPANRNNSSEIGNLSSIVKINLQSNGLTGKLPPELGNLKYLQELRLDRNRLLGTVPGSNGTDYPSSVHGMYASNGSPTGFCRSSQLKVADFSYNFLVGSIPKCLGYLPRSSFQGNAFKTKIPSSALLHNVVGYPPMPDGGGAPPAKAHSEGNTEHMPAAEESKHEANSSKPAWLLALEIATGTMVGVFFVIAIFTATQSGEKTSIIIPWKKSSSAKDHMTVYIVISLCIKKRSNDVSGYLELYFQKEVADLARLNHENVGKLLGYCRENSPFTRMLVFEYASNGTLYEHLHYGEACQFSWTRRMKIIVGIARGLKYLHTELDPPFTISELNSSSIYLTDDFSPKLVDFECWKTVLSRSEKSSGTISNEGAVCILPNSLEGRHLDIQGNIYAFGVILLEIVSGRPPYCKDKGCLVDWAKEFLELPEVMSYVVDPELKHFRYEDLKVICEVVSLCIYPNTSTRTSMRELCSMLESGIDTSVSAEIKASSLAWAELALSS
ncbi:UNVERIFIED_CONTAM: putative LRR receptor-like serine/threonine-protein kinase [Sesamum angustifolium]|uniref:LRR receptor-like serine/threonine-protein kinase n=1 Tax=Sesamum angustifolium TaxID=2727405 RepID=A0AAW2M8I6_9LAMI